MLPPIPPRTADAADAFNNPRRDRLISFLSRRPLLSLRDAESLGSVSWLNPIRTEARKVICDLALGVDIAALGYGGNGSIFGDSAGALGSGLCGGSNRCRLTLHRKSFA